MTTENETRNRKIKFERFLGLVALITVIAAWFVGAQRQETNLEPFLRRALPGAVTIEPLPAGSFVGKDRNQSTVGYVTIERSGGYGGPMRVAIGVDLTGKIAGIVIIDHKETVPFFRKVLNKKYPGVLVGKSYRDEFQIDKDLDAVSGATLSLQALVNSAGRGLRHIAGERLHLPVEQEQPLPIKFGLAEGLLLVLFAIGFSRYALKPRNKTSIQKSLRWTSRLLGILFIGFVYSIPLSIININSLLLGYLPDWRAHLSWYFLIVGVIFSLIAIGKSPYCDNFCPFGATQEVLKIIGGAKLKIGNRLHWYLQWLARVLAGTIIVLALLFRNPGRANYEVFGTFFSLTGSNFQFVLLAVVLVASLFIFRPWCNYLCPLRAVSDFIKTMRRWVVDVVRQ